MTISSETLPELRVQIVNFHDEPRLRTYDESEGFVVSFDGQKARVRIIGMGMHTITTDWWNLVPKEILYHVPICEMPGYLERFLSHSTPFSARGNF